MRELTSHKVNGLNEALTITVLDEPGCGGACHQYRIAVQQLYEGETVRQDVWFQKGPIAEAGVNGTSMEALLAIVEDRLIGFQSGDYANEENANALAHVQQALHWLHHRTLKRIARGVEGTLQK